MAAARRAALRLRGGLPADRLLQLSQCHWADMQRCLLKNAEKVGQTGHLPCCLLAKTNNTENNNTKTEDNINSKGAIFSWH